MEMEKGKEVTIYDFSAEDIDGKMKEWDDQNFD